LSQCKTLHSQGARIARGQLGRYLPAAMSSAIGCQPREPTFLESIAVILDAEGFFRALWYYVRGGWKIEMSKGTPNEFQQHNQLDTKPFRACNGKSSTNRTNLRVLIVYLTTTQRFGSRVPRECALSLSSKALGRDGLATFLSRNVNRSRQSRLMLNHISRIEQECSTSRDQHGLAQTHLAHKLRGNRKWENHHAQELKAPAELIARHHVSPR
jgi:hypothetical protein